MVPHFGQIVIAISDGGGGGRIAVSERRHRGRRDVLDIAARMAEILMVVMVIIAVVIIETVERGGPGVDLGRRWRPMAYWVVVVAGRCRRGRRRRRGIVGGGCRGGVVDRSTARWRYLKRMERRRRSHSIDGVERRHCVVVLRRLREQRRRSQMTEIAATIPVDPIV